MVRCVVRYKMQLNKTRNPLPGTTISRISIASRLVLGVFTDRRVHGELSANSSEFWTNKIYAGECQLYLYSRPDQIQPLHTSIVIVISITHRLVDEVKKFETYLIPSKLIFFLALNNSRLHNFEDNPLILFTKCQSQATTV